MSAYELLRPFMQILFKVFALGSRIKELSSGSLSQVYRSPVAGTGLGVMLHITSVCC